MNEPLPGFEMLPHAVFLRRLAGAREERAADARLGRAAFVALRLADLLGDETVSRDAFHYQHGATARACHGLPAGRTEAGHLLGVVASTSHAYEARDQRLVFPALFAYAHFLEDELRLDEALDVLATLERLGGGEAFRAEDRVATRLRTARVLRKLNRFDAAEAAYEEAGALAGTAGDRHAELLSRIGHGYVVTGRGNLPEAERCLRAVLASAETVGDQEAQALAHQGVAVVLSTSGQPTLAVSHYWRAYQLYDDELARLGLLGDLGVTLLAAGDAQGAERALTEVLRQATDDSVVDNALIELMHCASYCRDRVGFERWRERCQKRSDSMPPNVLADFLLKAGIGWARFGQCARAGQLLQRASVVAHGAGLHEVTFRIERISAGLDRCAESVAEAVPLSEPVREVSAALARLGP